MSLLREGIVAYDEVGDDKVGDELWKLGVLSCVSGGDGFFFELGNKIMGRAVDIRRGA